MRGKRWAGFASGRPFMDRELSILHETANLYLFDTGKRLEIRLNGATHAVYVGSPASVERGRRVMAALERDISQLRAMYQHW